MVVVCRTVMFVSGRADQEQSDIDGREQVIFSSFCEWCFRPRQRGHERPAFPGVIDYAHFEMFFEPASFATHL